MNISAQLAADKAASSQGDLFSVKADAVHALVVVCGTSEPAKASALRHITAVDPASNGIALVQPRKFHLDVTATKLSVRVATSIEPLVAADKVVVSGVAAMARQATAPPRTAQRSIPVGMHRRVPIDVTVRGYRYVTMALLFSSSAQSLNAMS